MSYEDKDQTAYDGSPVNLFDIFIDGTHYWYTNFQRDISVEIFDELTDGMVSRTFVPRQITRGKITQSTNLNDTSKTDIVVPRNDVVSYRVNGLVTPQFLRVAIYEVHATDADLEAKRLFSGFITDVSTSGFLTTLSVANITQSHMNALVPSVMYSVTCNHDFGDGKCQFDITEVSETAEVVTVAPWAITVDVGGLDDYRGGTITLERTSITQSIADVDDNVVFVVGGFSDIIAGDTVRLYMGCDHTIDGALGCAHYDNVLNFGGFPNVPRKNPFIKGFGEDDFREAAI